MLRILHVLIVAVVAAVIALPSLPAGAQTFLDMIFGSWSNATPSRTLPPSTFTPYQVPRGEDERPRPSGSFRTLCVRLCDGYYWPISSQTPRDRLSRDADLCASSCTSEARMFYVPGPGGEITDAQDLTGRAYKSLQNAFVYRKRQVASCACRPAPWSEAELQRHRNYAIAEGRSPEGASPQPEAEIVAGAGRTAVPPPVVVAGGPALAPAPTPAPEPRAAPDLGADRFVIAAPADRDGVQDIPSPPGIGMPATRTAKAPRPAVAKAQPAAKPRKVASQGPGWSTPLQSKYVWPGDSPVRYR